MTTQAINKRRSVIGITLGVALCALLFAGLIFMTGMQASAATFVDGGSWGDAHQWTLDGYGVLTISGTGDMPVLNSSDEAKTVPWYSHVAEIKSAVIADGVSKISNGIFGTGEYTALASATIGADVKSVGAYAFQNCPALETAVFEGSNVEAFGEGAFQQSGIVSIIIPDSVKTIGTRMFYMCTKLKSVTIGSGVTAFASMTFFGCSSLETVSIPDSVTDIGYMPFYNCSSLKSVKLSNTITYISQNCFMNCSALESIVIPDSVTEIIQNAFTGCFSLKTAVIGNGVTTIGNYAFVQCPALEKVVIGRSVTSIGSGCFGNSTKLATVINLSSLDLKPGVIDSTYLTANAKVVSSDINGYTFTTEDGWEFFYGEDECYLLGYTGSETAVVLPADCKGKAYNVAMLAFKGKPFTSVTISEKVKKIGKEAFSYCGALTEVKFNATAYDETDMGFTSSVFYQSGVSSGVTFTVGAGVKHVPAYLCNSSYFNLANVVFENGSICESIGAYAFSSNGDVKKKIEIPSSITAIGENSIQGFRLVIINSATVASGITEYGSYGSIAGSSYNTFTILVPSDAAFAVGSYVTANYTNVTTVKLGEVEYNVYSRHAHDENSESWTVNADGSCSCSACGLSATVVENETGNSGKCGEGLTWSFDATTGTLTVSGTGEMNGYSATSMPWSELADQIKKVVISEGVTSIGKNAFNCESVKFVFTEISLPETLTSIGNYAFYGCDKLTKVTIPDAVNTIGKYAFRRSGLTEITFESVLGWRMGNGEVYKFTTQSAALNALLRRHHNKVWTAATTNDYIISAVAFGGCGDKVNWALDTEGVLTITGEGDMYNYGSSNAPWASYKAQIKRVEISPEVTSIGNCAFYGCEALEEVLFSDDLVTIGDYAFYGCKVLNDVNITSSVRVIGKYAFRKCTAFTRMTCESTADETIWGYGDEPQYFRNFYASTVKSNYKYAWVRYTIL